MMNTKIQKKTYGMMVSLMLILAISVLFTEGNLAKAAKVKLVLQSGYPEMVPFYQQVMKDYGKSHPDVEIELTSFALREHERKLAVSLPTHTGPDIVEAAFYISYPYVQKRYLVENPPDIDAFVRSDAFQKITHQDILYEGKTYGVPMYQGSDALFYNETMLKEAGLATPPKTWQEMIAYACKLAEYDSRGVLTRSGISLRLSGAGSGVAAKWFYFFLAAGGRDLAIPTSDGKWQAGYNNEAGYETLKLFVDLLYKYHVDSHEIKHDAEAFALEATAMFVREPWVVGYMKEHAPNVKYNATYMPAYRQWATFTYINNIYVTDTCKNPDIAWDFVEFMLKPEYQRFIPKQIGWSPVRQDVDYSDILKETPQFTPFVRYPEGYEVYTHLMVGPIDEIYTKFADRLVSAFRDKNLLDNPTGIRKFLDDAAKETNDVLKKWKLFGKE